MKQALPRQRHFWTAETDKKLLDAVQLFGIDNWNLGMCFLIFFPVYFW